MTTTTFDELELVETDGLAQIDAVFEEEFYDVDRDGISNTPGSSSGCTCSVTNTIKHD